MPTAWPALVASTIRRLAHETLDPMFAQLKPESTRVRGRTRMLARTHGYLLHARAMHMLAFTSPGYACAQTEWILQIHQVLPPERNWMLQLATDPAIVRMV